MIWVWGALLVWGSLWLVNVRLANSALSRHLAVRVGIPVLFGFSILVLWEGLVRGLEVSQVILPPPSQVASVFVSSSDLLWIDFVQTVLKGALRGFVIGAVAALIVAFLIDRSSFLTRGLLPIGNFVA
ncbi:MAG: ABC transporter permease, partial [Pseudomonadota bacterium]